MASNKLQLSFLDPIVYLDGQLAGMPTKPFQDYVAALNRMVPSLSPLVVTDFGAKGNGTSDDTAAFQKAVTQAAANGGGVVLVPPGEYSLSTVSFPVGTAPVTLMGYGASSVLKRRGDLATGAGMLDIFGSNVTLDSLLIDGNVTTPTGLLYNADFMGAGGLNDPMADSLTRNTSVWLHPGANNFTADRIKLQHTGGYAILLDADGVGGLSDVSIRNSEFSNNRPHLFGILGGQAIFGSWSGGVYANADGTSANPGRIVRRFMVTGCRFLRNTGNALWGHSYGLEELNEDFQFIGNYFLDCGLDGILIGAVTGGAVLGNVFRRIGYTTLTDTDRSVPRWLLNLNATAIDSSGIVKSVIYAQNSMLSVNGGAIDADGHGDSSFTGNVARTPYPDEPEYEEDQIAISGPNNDGPYGYGINVGNTSNTAYGASNLSITGNTLINLRAGLVRLFAARRCSLEANTLIASANPVYPPVAMGPVGTGPNQRCSGNRVAHNKCEYSPSSAGAPFVFEDGQYSPFLASESNSVFGNNPITTEADSPVEFQKDPNSGSTVYSMQVWF